LTLRKPPEADVKQTFLGEFVEVELRGMPSDAEGVGGLVSTDGRRLSAHVEVKVTPNRVGECRDVCNPLREIVVGHEPTFPKNKAPNQKEAARSNVNATVL
jgi:hypothetical protein